MPLGIQRIVGLVEKAPSTFALGVGLPKDNLFAAYRKEFDEDIDEPEKVEICSENCLGRTVKRLPQPRI